MAPRTIFATLDELKPLAIPYDCGKWNLADQIEREGWNPTFTLPLLIEAGRRPRLLDGNKRVASLSRRGHGDWLIPVDIVFSRLAKQGFQH